MTQEEVKNSVVESLFRWRDNFQKTLLCLDDYSRNELEALLKLPMFQQLYMLSMIEHFPSNEFFFLEGTLLSYREKAAFKPFIPQLSSEEGKTTALRSEIRSYCNDKINIINSILNDINHERR